MENIRAIGTGLERLQSNLKGALKCRKIRKYFAILLLAKENHGTLEQKIEGEPMIKGHFLKAMKYNLKDACVRFAPEKWCYLVATSPWVKLMIASALFANPPKASLRLQDLPGSGKTASIYIYNLLAYGGHALAEV